MSDYYVGEIRLFAFSQYAPVGFLPCDGRVVAIASYQALYSIIGVTYGGDGRTTFGLPDLQGRSPVSFGQTVGGTNYVLAQTAGVETVTLTSAAVPAHTHTISVVNTAAVTMTPGPAMAPGNVGTNFYYCNTSQTGTGFTLAADTITQSGGGNQPHLNIQPSLVLAYAIAVNGLYPNFNS